MDKKDKIEKAGQALANILREYLAGEALRTDDMHAALAQWDTRKALTFYEAQGRALREERVKGGAGRDDVARLLAMDRGAYDRLEGACSVGATPYERHASPVALSALELKTVGEFLGTTGAEIMARIEELMTTGGE